jgi:hypothetical protein
MSAPPVVLHGGMVAGGAPNGMPPMTPHMRRDSLMSMYETGGNRGSPIDLQPMRSMHPHDGSDDSINLTSPTSSIASSQAGDNMHGLPPQHGHPHQWRGGPPRGGSPGPRYYRPPPGQGYGPSTPPPGHRGSPRCGPPGQPPRGPPQMFRPPYHHMPGGARSPTPSPPYSPRGPPRRGGPPPPGHPRYRGGPRFRAGPPPVRQGGPHHLPLSPGQPTIMSPQRQMSPGTFQPPMGGPGSASSTPPSTPGTIVNVGAEVGAGSAVNSPTGSGSDRTLSAHSGSPVDQERCNSQNLSNNWIQADNNSMPIYNFLSLANDSIL